MKQIALSKKHILPFLTALLFVLSLVLLPGKLNLSDNKNVAQAATVNLAPTEISCDVANVSGFGGEYVRWAAGPVLEPRYNSFIGVLEVRNRDNTGAWTNTFSFYAERLSMDCGQLLYKNKLGTNFSDSQSSLTVYYPGDGSIYGYFGVNVRDPNTAAFIPRILTVRFN